jgi:hypothetical protein
VNSQVTHVQHGPDDRNTDTTLAAMLWEEGLAPADAAERWGTSSVTRRIKRLYANRLGGNWDLEGTGPVANWRRQIAEVRNSAISHWPRATTELGGSGFSANFPKYVPPQLITASTQVRALTSVNG